MVRNVLMVAEKPSLAEAIAHHLSDGRAQKRQRAVPVYEYDGSFYGSSAFFKVTSTTGHVFGIDFTAAHQNWEKVDEDELFHAPVVKKENSGPKIVHHLSHEAEHCDTLVLWLDCDREGENICFEVMNVVKRSIHRADCIFRAKFSAITREEIWGAFRNLGKPNKNLSDAVDCRQELDLKVGCAFTRFQTKFFTGKYGDLDANVVSYGPCQTPTLAFCVQRHDEILNFKPEAFWRVTPVANRGGVLLSFEWDRVRVFDEPLARMMHRKVAESKTAKVVQVSTSNDTKVRPTALNTVELMKIASRQLGLGPHQTMSVAEHLYISGYISYPRTESTAYPSSFNLAGALAEQKRNPIWGGFVSQLLQDGYTRPKSGVDAGDHPPITPMRSATLSELSGDSWRVYEYITRHFIATLSPDCKLKKTKIVIELNEERFSLNGCVVETPGFTEIMPQAAVRDDKLPDVKVGDDFVVSDIRLVAGQTQAPSYLTEADLVGLMEKHGIGTDASISQHINNIVIRGFCTVESGRTMHPTKLGVVLVHGIQSIDPELVLPTVRSKVEEYLTHIAAGSAKLDDVLPLAIDLFQRKFRFFRANVDRLDGLMGASFSPLSASGSYLTRCGVCTRYLRFLEARPQRLYCQTCEVTFNLPQTGQIKQFGNFTCPLDNFELVILHVDGGKSTAICPNCYNNPPFEDFPEGKRMSCDDCKHPTCFHSLATNYVCDCIDEGCTGSMAFVPRSTGKWKICCNNCPMMLLLPPTAQKVKVSPTQECPDCGARCMDLTFPPGKSTLANRADHVVGCVFCDAGLASVVEEVRGRVSGFGRGGRGGRARGRGRGGRGRGRGRGRRDDF